jgi:hypothetical protein
MVKATLTVQTTSARTEANVTKVASKASIMLADNVRFAVLLTVKCLSPCCYRQYSYDDGVLRVIAGRSGHANLQVKGLRTIR